MSQAKLEFLAGKSVPAIIDWMLENMKETDIRGCLDAAGIQTSVGSRSVPSSSGAGSSTDPLPPFSSAAAAGSRPFSRAAAAGSSTDPLPPFSRAAAAGSSTDPLPPFSSAAAAGSRPFSSAAAAGSRPFSSAAAAGSRPFSSAAAAGSRPFSSAAAAGSSTDPLPFSSAATARGPFGGGGGYSESPGTFGGGVSLPVGGPEAGSSTDPLPFFTPGAATGFLSRNPSEEQIRPGFYEPPSPFMRQPSEEMIDPYSTFIAPGLKQGLLGGNEFGNSPFPSNTLSDINRYIKIQIEEQTRARENNIIGQRINIPILIFNLVDEGEDYLSFIQFEPSGQPGLILTNIITISAAREGNNYNKELELEFKTKIGTLLNKWGTLLDISTEEYQQLISEIDSSFENFLSENSHFTNIRERIELLYSRENIENVRGIYLNNEDFSDMQAINEEYMIRDEDLNNEYSDNEYADNEDSHNEYGDNEDSDSEEKNPFQIKPAPIKKYGKISDMNKNQLREYVINKFGQSYFNEYEPQVYTTKFGFSNVRYVKRSVPLSEPLNISNRYDYSIEEGNENGPVSFF